MRPTVLFDIDGTLLHLDGVGRRAMTRAMEEVWGIPDALRNISFAGATDGGIAERVAPGRERAPMWRRYLDHLETLTGERTSTLDPLAGVEPLLDALHESRARVGLLTGNVKEGARLKLRAVGLHGRFDWSLSAFAEDGDLRTSIAAAARARCGGSDVPLTIVGDTIHDIRCARHIDARVLCVATGAHDQRTLAAERPDRLENDLTATGALVDWLLQQP